VELPIGFDYPTKMVKSSLNLWSALSLLEQDGVIEIVSEPSILALNNQESSIYIGKRQSIQTSTSVDKNGNPIPHIERVDIGLLLKVKPRLTKNDKVMLDIVVEQEASK
jgi:general secretion pathway protein D